MVLPTQWRWVWANSGRWLRTGKPGMLQSMGSQRVRHHWATEKPQQSPAVQTGKLCLPGANSSTEEDKIAHIKMARKSSSEQIIQNWLSVTGNSPATLGFRSFRIRVWILFLPLAQYRTIKDSHHSLIDDGTHWNCSFSMWQESFSLPYLEWLT